MLCLWTEHPFSCNLIYEIMWQSENQVVNDNSYKLNVRQRPDYRWLSARVLLDTLLFIQRYFAIYP